MKISKTNFHQRGFTMIEMIVVLIVMAIFSTVVYSRFNTGNAELIAQADVLKSHLRYAQLMAMNDTSTWGIKITNSTTYELFKTAVTPPPSNLPGDNSYTHVLTGNIEIIGSSVSFNEWGTPVDGSGTLITTSPLMTLKPSTGTGIDIIIEGITGFIP
jgi:prepilin-type N-terminal cleavage/methylation domain-containing protein